MAEPLMPHPENPDTALDEHEDAPVPEQHGEPEEADRTLTSAGRAAQEGPAQDEDGRGDDPLPAFPADEVLRD